MAFNNLAENAERLSRRIQETLQERTRELTKASTTSYLDAPDLEKPGNIQKLLDSSSDRDKLEGLKRLIAMISKNRNVSSYFAQVVKNVASSNLEIRKLVYIYLLRYAESEPDLALLSINTFQKDLNDFNPLIRAMALRVLSGIPVPMIGSIVVLGIKKCAADPSPYVRKAAALAIPKCYSLDSSHLPELMQILTNLLKDESPLSIGSVALAFTTICPHRLELLHQHYRRLCRIIVDTDEWGQVHLLDLLGRYARTMLNKPPIETPVEQEYVQEDERGLDQDLDLLIKSVTPLFRSRNAAVVLAVCRTYYYLAPSNEYPKIIEPLLRLLHTSKAIERVVLEDIVLVAKALPDLFLPHTSRFLVRATDAPRTKMLKLQVLVQLINPDNVQTLLREFKDYVLDTHDDLVSKAIWAIGQCALLVPEATDSVMTALTMLVRSSNEIAVTAAVLALKSLHQTQLSTQTASGRKSVDVVARLARRFDDIQHPTARACIIWMVGQYASVPQDINGQSSLVSEGGVVSGITPYAPDTLRKAAKSFNLDASKVKNQTLALAAKLYVLSPVHPAIRLLSRYVFTLARYDSDYDVRDRGRMLSSLLLGVEGGVFKGSAEGSDEAADYDQRGGVVLRREQVRLVLFEGKTIPHETDKWSSLYTTIGTMSLIIQKDLPGTFLRKYPEWPDEGTDSSLRDTENDKPKVPFYAGQPSLNPANRIIGIGSQNISGSSPSLTIPTPIILTPGGPSPVGSAPKPGMAKGPWMDLDKFYESSDEEDEEEDDDEEEEEEQVSTRRSAVATVELPQPPAVLARTSSPALAHLPPATYDLEESEEEEEETDDEEEDDAFLRRTG